MTCQKPTAATMAQTPRKSRKGRRSMVTSKNKNVRSKDYCQERSIKRPNVPLPKALSASPTASYYGLTQQPVSPMATIGRVIVVTPQVGASHCATGPGHLPCDPG